MKYIDDKITNSGSIKIIILIGLIIFLLFTASVGLYMIFIENDTNADGSTGTTETENTSQEELNPEIEVDDDNSEQVQVRLVDIGNANEVVLKDDSGTESILREEGDSTFYIDNIVENIKVIAYNENNLDGQTVDMITIEEEEAEGGENEEEEDDTNGEN